MENLARGWAIVWAHMHGHIAGWIAILTPLAVGWWIVFWVARRKRNGEDGAP